MSGKKSEVVRIKVDISTELKVETLEMVEEEPSGIVLENAEVIVAGGWGLASVGDFKLIEELAKALGGAVAGTRPAMDSGWIPESGMIGQSGKTVSPRLFISVGASGAPQFTSGFTKSKVVLTIDKNRKAPIFEVADVGLVGDLRDIVPHLIEELKTQQFRIC